MYKNQSFIFLMIDNYINNLDQIIEIIKRIILTKKYNIENLFLYPLNDNSLFYLIYAYYKPELFGTQIKIPITFNQIQKFIKLYKPNVNYTNHNGQTPIFYIGIMNDIKMLDLFIENSADINYISMDGYYNFCHFIAKYSNFKMINHVLNLNINFNNLNFYNETPIFSMLRNTNFLINQPSSEIEIKPTLLNNTILEQNIKSDSETKSNLNIISEINTNLISIPDQFILINKLLLKTNDWNLQNIYGQTIIHILCYRSDIEDYYKLLATKYIDPNIKNVFGSSLIDILKESFKLKKYDIKKIDSKIEEFRELIADNYIKILYNNKTIDIPNNIKLNCQDYKSNNPNKKNTTCWINVINNLSKEAYTDIDKLSKDYRNIIIDDHEFAYYNLYNARDSDVYIYYIILMIKHPHLGVGINDNIIESNILDISLYNPKTMSGLLYVDYYQSVLGTTLKYYNLYPLNIYWLNSTNYTLPYNMVESVKSAILNGKKFIIIRINICTTMLHKNILIIDDQNNRIIRFEPHGGIKDNMDILDNKIFLEFKKNKYFANFKYFKPSDYEPINGLQNLSQEYDLLLARKGDINGYCVAWCLWFIEFYIQNSNNKLLSDENFKLLIPKVIKRLINSGNILVEYIRNYANYMHKKLLLYLTTNLFKYHTIYYFKYNNTELDDLYNHIDQQLNIMKNL